MHKKLFLISISSLFFSASYNILIPELPNYLIQLGGQNYLGGIILLFTLAALLSRPFSGLLSDTKGGKAVVLIGVCVSIIANFTYSLTVGVVGFLLLRFFHGFSTGFAPTGYTYLAKSMHSDQGKAISIQTAFFAAGMALGPLLGDFIAQQFGIHYLFYSGSLLGLLALLCMLPIKEVLPINKKVSQTSNLMIDKKVWKPALGFFWIYLSFGILLIASPIIAHKIGFANKGIFFLFFTISTIGSRLFLRAVFQKENLKKLLYIATVLLMVGSVCFALWQTKIGFILASLIYGFSMGIFIPALNLWALKNNSGEDGKAISTLYILMEIGIGIGAFLIGTFLLKFESSFTFTYLLYALFSLFLFKLFKRIS